MKTRPPDPINASEYAQVVALWQMAGLPVKLNGRDSEEAFEQQMASGLQTAIGVKTDDGALIGVVLTTHDGRKGWINRLAVHPDWRRQGIGQELIEAAEARLHQQGLDVIAALIEPENDASLELFQKAGYAEFSGLHYVSKRSRDDV